MGKLFTIKIKDTTNKIYINGKYEYNTLEIISDISLEEFMSIDKKLLKKYDSAVCVVYYNDIEVGTTFSLSKSNKSYINLISKMNNLL